MTREISEDIPQRNPEEGSPGNPQKKHYREIYRVILQKTPGEFPYIFFKSILGSSEKSRVFVETSGKSPAGILARISGGIQAIVSDKIPGNIFEGTTGPIPGRISRFICGGILIKKIGGIPGGTPAKIPREISAEISGEIPRRIYGGIQKLNETDEKTLLEISGENSG